MQKIVNRDYQQECIDTINRNPEGRYLIALATGLGKTVIFSQIQRHGRMLILSHRDELVRQPEKYFDCSFSVEKANEHAGDTEVVSASVQTLSSDSRLRQFKPDDFYTIVIDEAHHAAAHTYKKILSYFTGAKQIIGMTATPRRGDKLQLSDVFDNILYQKDLRWGIMHHYLAPIRAERVFAKYSLKGVRKVGGDYNQGDLDHALLNADTVATTARAYFDECHNRGRQTLIYCTSVSMCDAILSSIQELLPEDEKNTVAIVTGATPAYERAGTLKEFSDKKLRCIINCMVLTEGTDLPVCDAIICLRPTCNSSLYQQIVGRGTRLAEGKEYCLVIDVVPEDGSYRTRSFCTAPTLFGVEPKYLTDEELEEIDEDHDLVSLCEEFSGVSHDVLSKLKTEAKAFRVFCNSIDEVLAASNGGTLTDLYANYLSYLDLFKDSDDEMDFKGLCVSHQASEEKYYKIQPNYDDAIYMSKPDVLDNVTLEFDIHPKCLDLPDMLTKYRGSMKFDKALAFIQSYCECEPDYYRYAWNKEAREKWREEKCSSKQAGRLRYEISELEHYSIDCSDAFHLNKLVANDLISLIQLYKANKKKAAVAQTRYQNAQKQAVSGVHSEDRSKVTLDEGNYIPLEKLAKSIADFQKKGGKKVLHPEQTEDAKKARLLKQEEIIKHGSISYEAELRWYGGRSASAAQINLLQGLLSRMRQKNITLKPYPNLNNLSMSDATCLITFFLSYNINHWVPMRQKVTFYLYDITARHPGRNPRYTATVRCAVQ